MLTTFYLLVNRLNGILDSGRWMQSLALSVFNIPFIVLQTLRLFSSYLPLVSTSMYETSDLSSPHVPVTSRRPKVDEKDGQMYSFMSRTEMDCDIKSGRFLEHGEYDGNVYGTKINSIHEVVDTGKICILDVNPQVGFTLAGRRVMFLPFWFSPSFFSSSVIFSHVRLHVPIIPPNFFPLLLDVFLPSFPPSLPPPLPFFLYLLSLPLSIFLLPSFFPFLHPPFFFLALPLSLPPSLLPFILPSSSPPSLPPSLPLPYCITHQIPHLLCEAGSTVGLSPPSRTISCSVMERIISSTRPGASCVYAVL